MGQLSKESQTNGFTENGRKLVFSAGKFAALRAGVRREDVSAGNADCPLFSRQNRLILRIYIQKDCFCSLVIGFLCSKLNMVFNIVFLTKSDHFLGALFIKRCAIFKLR